MERQLAKSKKRHKKWKVVFVMLVFLLMLFREPETVMQQENTRIYQVYCMGDSITYGSGLSEEERDTCCYPAVLEQLLGAHYEVINYGVSGRTLLNIPEKSYRGTGYVDIVKMQQPDIIIVMLGSNDSRAERWDALAYKEEYISLVEELQAIESHPKIYIMTPPEAFPWEDGEIIYGISNDIIHDEVGRIVREVATETGVNVIDLYAVTEDHPEYFADGLHPNKEGYSVVAQAIYEQIAKDNFENMTWNYQ
ncbi:MAG: GDSL-type esterase/lipase family protein [Roseburia sp.]|nr:GDSL-type esterase/lipase family protein [Roseburia sp.]